MCRPPRPAARAACAVSRVPARITASVCSVFECEVAPDQWVMLRARLLAEMDMARDSLRFYFLGAAGKRRIEHVGAKSAIDFDSHLIV